MDERERRARQPEVAIWIWMLVGLIGVQIAREKSSFPGTPRNQRVLNELSTKAADLGSSSGRELRRLPAIGKHRAVQVTRARWDHDPESGALQLGDLPGIGPITESRVRRALDRGGDSSGSLEIVPASTKQ